MIKVSEAAGLKVQELLHKEGRAGQALRVFVAGGGCSGFQYGLAFDDTPAEDDWIIEEAGIEVYVDSTSATYLSGAQIDYVDGLMESGFVVHNPNAVSSCACGHSFKAASGNGQAGEHAHQGGDCCGSH